MNFLNPCLPAGKLSALPAGKQKKKGRTSCFTLNSIFYRK
jgi:hypothetical protein